MKAETWIFAICTVFFLLVAPAYWFITGDPTGTSALTMTFLLTLLVTFYLGVHSRRMVKSGSLRPAARQAAEIADGAGELGFFPPYSWWPLWAGATLGLIVFGTAMGAWWLLIIGFGLGALATCGWIYEYYVGEHAH